MHSFLKHSLPSVTLSLPILGLSFMAHAYLIIRGPAGGVPLGPCQSVGVVFPVISIVPLFLLDLLWFLFLGMLRD